jgi:hypothetical protein
MDLWIARDTGLLIRDVRSFLDDRWAFSEQRIASTFAYEDLEAMSPPESGTAPDLSNSCEKIKQMIGRFNSVEPIQVDIRASYLAVAKFSHSLTIIAEGKQYTRENGRPWYVTSRQSTASNEISDCVFYGDEDFNGVPALVYGYHRVDAGNGGQRILSWVAKETGLPIREYFITVNPDNGKERLVSYSYDPKLKKPN